MMHLSVVTERGKWRVFEDVRCRSVIGAPQGGTRVRASGHSRSRHRGARVAMSDAVDQPGCPQCGRPVSTTVATSEPGERLSLDRIECPNCGSPLVRDVEGHADRGWRLGEQHGG